MNSTTEFEVKLEFPVAEIARLQSSALLSHLAAKKLKERQLSVYFDTPRHVLAKHGLSLRIRRSAHQSVQTIKAMRDSPISRAEWETPVHGCTLDFDAADGTPLQPLLTVKRRQNLQPIFKMLVERTVYPLALASADIELTIDDGIIRVDHQSVTLCEVEIELKRGEQSRVFDIAREIVKSTSAILSIESKAERGYALAVAFPRKTKRRTPAIVRQVFAPGDTLTTVARSLGYVCLKQILENWRAVLAHDPQAVHQIRVGIRRMRTVMFLFRHTFAIRPMAQLKAELKWLMGELGPARECHVVQAFVHEFTPDTLRRGRLDKALDAQARQANMRAGEAVLSERFRCLTLDIAIWLETFGQTPPPQNGQKNGDRTIGSHASAEIDRLWSKIRRRGRKLGKLDELQCHNLRILVKKLRYAFEFFKNLYQSGTSKQQFAEVVTQAEKLQDALGALNDMTNQQKLLHDAIQQDGEKNKPDAQCKAVVKHMADQRHKHQKAKTKAAKQAYARLFAAETFW
eukprot:gene9501-9582_t